MAVPKSLLTGRMSLNRICISPVFSQRHHPVQLRFDCKGTIIVVDTVHVPALLVKPAASFIDQPAFIHLSQLFCGLAGIKLAPPLIERNPGHNAGMIVQMTNHSGQIPVILASALQICPAKQVVILVLHPSGKPIRGIGQISHKTHMILSASIGHILPHNHPQPVAVIIKTIQLHLHMLAERIISHLLQLFNII